MELLVFEKDGAALENHPVCLQNQPASLETKPICRGDTVAFSTNRPRQLENHPGASLACVSTLTRRCGGVRSERRVARGLQPVPLFSAV